MKFWNRHINFYRQQGAGVPQDLFGECSRILANFYLQDYDRNISEYCLSMGGQYFRYADDQVFFAKESEDLESLIAKASSLLMKEGLNFNQKKVKIMSFEGFREFYAFDNFLQLASNVDPGNIEKIVEEQINLYLETKEKLRKQGLSLLKRILNVLKKHKFQPSNIQSLKNSILDYEFIVTAPFDSKDWKLLYDLFDEAEKMKLTGILREICGKTYYSLFLYHQKKFFGAIQQPTTDIDERIEELKSFYSLI